MRNEKGITLIALIITIIVMLILVAVTINVTLNGGLFSNASKASKDTQREVDREELLSAVSYALNYNTGMVDRGKLAGDLGTNWKVTGEGPYTCTSPNGNVFTVENNGNIVIAGTSENTGENGGNTHPGENENPGEEPDDPTLPEEDNIPETYAKAEDLILGTNVRLVSYEDLTEGDIKTAVDSGKISAVIEEIVGEGQNRVTYTAVVPIGYTVSSTENENTITKGLVIYDGTSSNRNNEFVWIPVPNKDMKVATVNDQYVGATNHAEPKTVTAIDGNTGQLSLIIDSQQELDYYYGDNYFTYPDDISNENNVTDFSYGVHYKEMAQSVNKYGGFYIGRYETTIDNSNNVGSKYNTTVLTADRIIKEGTNENANTGGTYTYRWWGIYYASRHANVEGNGSTVQTNMIWGQQWDKMIAYLSSKSIDYSAIDTSTYNKPSNKRDAGQATYRNKTDNTDVIKDEIFNIYDLRKNVYEWTAEVCDTTSRVLRGGYYGNNNNAEYRYQYAPYPAYNFERFSTYTLYNVDLNTFAFKDTFPK